MDGKTLRNQNSKKSFHYCAGIKLHFEQYSTLIQDYKYLNIIVLFIDINQYLHVICSIMYNKYLYV